MFYVVWRETTNDKVGGFITDDKDMPAAFNTKEEAEKSTEGHILEDISEVVEL